MPAIRSLQVNSDSITFVDDKGTHTFLASDIPQSSNTPSKVETFVNNWLAANITDYQIAVHVISVNPLNASIYTADFGATIPSNWWNK
jgi:hypothetical protein